jgi:hypothetical protein
MPTDLEQIEAEATKLTTSEHAGLPDRLWLTTDPQESVAAARDAGIERRIAVLEAGPTQSMPAKEVFREGRDLIGK